MKCEFRIDDTYSSYLGFNVVDFFIDNYVSHILECCKPIDLGL